MTIYNKPSDLPAWAESGDKVQPTNAEIQTGWPLSTVPPSRQRFNWVLNWLATGVRYFMQRGIPEWDATEEYPAGARVQYNNATYISLTGTSNTGQQPDTATTFWERWAYSDTEMQPRVDQIATFAVTTADVTLTSEQAKAGILNVTGTLTGNRNIIIPNTARRLIVINGTSGAFTLAVKTASGTAVTVGQGGASSIVCDGNNNIKLASADLTAYAPIASPTFTGNPAGPTPAQFDNDTSLATTTFVQRALGNLQTVTMYNASQVLTASQVGSEIMAYGTAAMTLTLPALSTVPVGASFKFWSNNTNATNPIVACAGADLLRTGGGTQANISLGAGDSLVIEKTSSSEWLVSGGTKSLKFSDVFATSLAANGYQKLPSGLIIQWGVRSCPFNTSNTANAVTLPIAFPNAALSIVTNINHTTPVNISMNSITDAITTSSFTIRTYSNNTFTANVYWIAIGY